MDITMDIAWILSDPMHGHKAHNAGPIRLNDENL